MLKVVPVKKYRFPGYPDKRNVLENPDILKTFPQRWKGKLSAGLAFSSISILLLSGCQRPEPTAGVMPGPVYLTEEEAYAIVLEEAEKYGVVFDKDGLELKDVEFVLDNKTSENENSTVYKLDMQLDGYNNEKKIGFEFISDDDFMKFNDDIEKLVPDGTRRDWIRDYSVEFEEAVKHRNERIYFDAFYTSEYFEIEDAKAALREQVISFMEWLKSQGVI